MLLLSVVGILAGLVAAAIGFLLVVAVCVVILALMQAVLPTHEVAPKRPENRAEAEAEAGGAGRSPHRGG